MEMIILLMWMADISDKLQMVAIMLALCLSFIAFVMYTDRKSTKTPLTIAAALLLLFTVIPSKQTVYGYVALYAGKEIVESKVGQKAYQALDSILDDIIKKSGDKKEK